MTTKGQRVSRSDKTDAFYTVLAATGLPHSPTCQAGTPATAVTIKLPRAAIEHSGTHVVHPRLTRCNPIPAQTRHLATSQRTNQSGATPKPSFLSQRRGRMERFIIAIICNQDLLNPVTTAGTNLLGINGGRGGVHFAAVTVLIAGWDGFQSRFSARSGGRAHTTKMAALERSRRFFSHRQKCRSAFF